MLVKSNCLLFVVCNKAVQTVNSKQFVFETLHIIFLTSVDGHLRANCRAKFLQLTKLCRIIGLLNNHNRRKLFMQLIA